MGAIIQKRRDCCLRITIMPGKGGAHGVLLAFLWQFRRFVLGKRSHVGILLWGHSKSIKAE